MLRPSFSSAPRVGFLFLLALALFTPPALAGQVYVNSATGSDGNLGTSPEQAFKTIRKALTVSQADNDMLRLAAGDYSAASGEVFPLVLGGQRIVGDAGAALTRIVGSGNDVLLEATCPGDPAGSMLVLEGLSLVGGRTGLRVHSDAHQYIVALSNLEIHGMSQDGVESHTTAGRATDSLTTMFLTSVTISGCLRGLSFESSSPTPGSYVSVGLSTLRDNAIAVDLTTSGDATVQVLHSRIEDNTQAGLRGSATSGGHARIDVQNSLVVRNGVGIGLGGFGADGELSVVGCTITGNTVGIATDLGPNSPSTAGISDSIIWGNADDVSLGGPVSASFNDCGDGGLGLADGNFSADPLFRNAAAGDYRLRRGSPAVDAATPVQPFSLSQDMLLNVRPSDGLLDAHADADLGCFEFAPLELVGPEPGLVAELQPGETLRIESWGPAGAVTTLLLSLGTFNGCPAPTGFGTFFLNASQFVVLTTMPAGPVTPGVLQAVIPMKPLLVGLDFSFQGLTTSPLAPRGKALTNPAQLSVRN